MTASAANTLRPSGAEREMYGMNAQKPSASHKEQSTLNRLALKAGLFYIFAQLLVRGITFLTTPILTRLLSKAQYSDIRLYESWLLIIGPVFSLNLYRSVERAKYDTGENYNEFVSCTSMLSYLSIGFCFLVCLFFKEPVKIFCDMNDLMFYTAFLYTFAHTAIMFMQRREKQLMRYKVSTAVTAVTVIPATLLSILLIWIGRETGHTDALVSLRVIGYYVPFIIAGISIAAVLLFQGKKAYSRAHWRYALLFSLPLIPEAISIQIMNQSDRIMVRHLIGKEEVAILALGTTVSYIIWIREDSVWNAWLPWLYEKISRKETKDVEKPWTILMHGFGMLSWFLVLLAPEIVAILGSSEYRDCIYLTAPMLTGTLFRFYSYSYTAVENYHKKTGYVAAATVGTMLLNVILNYVCIKSFGYRAAAYTTAFSYFVLLLVQSFMEYRLTGALIIPIKKTVAVSLAYFALCCASMLLFACPSLIRYGVLAAGVLLAAKFLLPQCFGILKLLKK